jgi:hypothetical protein
MTLQFVSPPLRELLNERPFLLQLNLSATMDDQARSKATRLLEILYFNGRCEAHQPLESSVDELRILA